MSANTSTLPLHLLLALTKRKTPLLEQIETQEAELSAAEIKAAEIKGRIDLLKKKHVESVVLRWRDEIRGCMRHIEGHYLLVTPAQIISCIEYKNSIEATRDMKNKVASTLSLMYREGEVGRVDTENGNFYGHKSLFNDDLKTLKKKYSKLLP